MGENSGWQMAVFGIMILINTSSTKQLNLASLQKNLSFQPTLTSTTIIKSLKDYIETLRSIFGHNSCTKGTTELICEKTDSKMATRKQQQHCMNIMNYVQREGRYIYDSALSFCDVRNSITCQNLLHIIQICFLLP